MERRIGIFEVPAVLFWPSHYAEMAVIQKDLIVLHIESNFCSNKAKVFAAHPEFDEVGEGAITPYYELVMERGDDGAIASVSFRRSENA
ncbi:hypothetical protein [Aeromonas veronii]|uniref:hypothetical protein n=1 Tax=Aeromonas veronii TaxID=654 RepID=UPI0024855730|nr:hypothetical protein [Aeromonas veronii]